MGPLSRLETLFNLDPRLCRASPTRKSWEKSPLSQLAAARVCGQLPRLAAHRSDLKAGSSEAVRGNRVRALASRVRRRRLRCGWGEVGKGRCEAVKLRQNIFSVRFGRRTKVRHEFYRCQNSRSRNCESDRFPTNVADFPNYRSVQYAARSSW
jgi:hypothetical protein